MSKTGKSDEATEINKPTEEEITQALEPGNDNSLPEIPEDDAEPDPFVLLERLNADNEELTNQVLRLAADMENLRRRTDREKVEASKYANSDRKSVV